LWGHIYRLKLLLGTHMVIAKWSEDTEECDRVLRIIPKVEIHENEITQMITINGFASKILKIN